MLKTSIMKIFSFSFFISIKILIKILASVSISRTCRSNETFDAYKINIRFNFNANENYTYFDMKINPYHVPSAQHPISLQTISFFIFIYYDVLPSSSNSLRKMRTKKKYQVALYWYIALQYFSREYRTDQVYTKEFHKLDISFFVHTLLYSLFFISFNNALVRR